MKSIARALALAAVATCLSLNAEDTDDITKELDDDTASAEPTGEAEDLAAQVPAAKSETKYFYTLPRVRRVDGKSEIEPIKCLVLKPGAAEWEDAEEGRYYPLGTSFKTVGTYSKMIVDFGPECSVIVSTGSSFRTRAKPLSDQTREIMLDSGIIKLKLPRGLPEGRFSVSAPGFTAVNLAGNSSYRYSPMTGDGDVATVRCVTGTLGIEGRHFKIPSMRAANEVRIQTSQDNLFTGIFGTRGDYIVRLDQGQVKVRDVETGESHIEEKALEWKMSPQTAVRIHRAVPAIGANMAVSVMTFDAMGALKNRCAFTEHRFEINSGELAPSSDNKQAELAKQAAEATTDTAAVETEATETEATESEADESSSGDSSEG